MDENCKRRGQIPAFGNWEYANELPITQYFECARQAGLIRYSCSSGEQSDPYVRGDIYTIDRPLKSSRAVAPPARKTRTREKRYPLVKEQKKQTGGKVAKVRDVMEQPVKQYGNQLHHLNDAVLKPHRLPTKPPKPVDEDLYKIPPELLQTTKKVGRIEPKRRKHFQKKILGIFSRCLVPACTS